MDRPIAVKVSVDIATAVELSVDVATVVEASVDLAAASGSGAALQPETATDKAKNKLQIMYLSISSSFFTGSLFSLVDEPQ